MDKYLGKRLDGRYEMRELIGVGGMAYVYKAYDAVDDRIVAVKILKDEFLNSDEFVRRFRNESKAIAILNHANIVKVLDVGFGERLQYIVMEYIDGITLKEYLDQRKDIRWKEAVHFTVQILRALQHAHDKGIVHRDIKPQNIMLLSDGTIKVTDFGIARLTRNEMKATVEGNKAIGSVHYISPEQARGEITDEKTDLYAVGIMLYEMLTGRLPFEADNAVSVAIMQMQSEAQAPRQINEEIPEGLEQITLKAMQKDTAKRYQSAAEMLSDFDEFKRNPSIKFEYTYMVDETPTRYVDAITRVRGESPEPALNTKKEEPAKKKAAPKKKKKKNKNTVRLVILIITLCLVAGLLAAVIWMAIGIWNGDIDLFSKWLGKAEKKADEITVEKFIGKNYYAEIEGAVEYQGKYTFKIVLEDSKKSDVKKGEVFQQEPAAGKTIKENGTVTLYVHYPSVSKYIQLDPRAEIEGQPKEDVFGWLEDAGFEINEIPSSSEHVPAGCVISIDINKEEQYLFGHEVTVLVSTGPSELDPMLFPQDIIGESKDAVEAVLAVEGFVGEITTIDANYTDEKHKEVGTVIGVMVDGVLQETLPATIQPDGALTLVLSNGLKNVMVELEWPKGEDGKNVNLMLNVRVDVAGVVDAELSNKYASIKPSNRTDKMTFEFVNHPANQSYPYYAGVDIKISDTANDYKTYAKLLIDPVAGTWEIEGGYQYIEGINPHMIAFPDGVLQQMMSLGELKAKLSDFRLNGITVSDEKTMVKVDRVVYKDNAVTAGTLIKKGETITVTVTPMVVIPSNIFSMGITTEEAIKNAFSKEVQVVDKNGAGVSDEKTLLIYKLVYNNTEVTSADALPEALPADANITIYVDTSVKWGEVKSFYENYVCIFVNKDGNVVEENDDRKITDIRVNDQSVIGKEIEDGSQLIFVTVFSPLS